MVLYKLAATLHLDRNGLGLKMVPGVGFQAAVLQLMAKAKERKCGGVYVCAVRECPRLGVWWSFP